METKNMNRILRATVPILALLAVLAPWPVAAQTVITETSLSSAVTSTSATSITVASATTVTAGNWLYIDRELMDIISVSGTTATVRRGVEGTGSATHLSGARVYVQTPRAFTHFDVSGSCTASNELYLPHINVSSGQIADCDGRGAWLDRVGGGLLRDETSFEYWVRRDSFEQGYLIMQDDGTGKSVTDDEDNFVYGSPLGAIEYREELTKTTSSWVVADGTLDISADDTTDDEGVEIIFGTGEGTDMGVFVAGTTGACVSGVFTVADISGTDQVQLGFRQNEVFVDAAAYAGYTVWNTIGINATDGSIVSSQEVSEATDTDDSAVNWADGEIRGLKVCVSSSGVPTAYYTAALSNDEISYPTWVAVTMTETGSTWTAGVQGVPTLSYLAAGTDGADVVVHWIQLETAP